MWALLLTSAEIPRGDDLPLRAVVAWRVQVEVPGPLRSPCLVPLASAQPLSQTP